MSVQLPTTLVVKLRAEKNAASPLILSLGPHKTFLPSPDETEEKKNKFPQPIQPVPRKRSTKVRPEYKCRR
jgi:hypothetical protein